MSVVTSIIILFPRSEWESKRVTEINKFSHDGNVYPFLWIDDENVINRLPYGNRIFNSVLLLGSFNNFPTKAFLQYLHESVKWDDIDSVQVLVNSEEFNDKSCSIYGDAGGKLLLDSEKW